MKILVCVKQIVDLEARLRVNDDGTWIDCSDLALRMNEYDEYAVEQAVRFKEQCGADQVDVTVLSIGAATVTETLKKALAMGCDRAVHINDDAAWRKDPAQIAAIIAAFAADKGFDLILAGMQSQDRGSAQVGALVAQRLGYGCVTTVIDCDLQQDKITVRRELEGGLKAVVEVELPALLTCQLGLNTPRYPTLPNIMKAKRKELLSIDVEEFACPDPLVRTVALTPPPRKGNALIIEGGNDEVAAQLAKILVARRVA